MWVDSLIGIPDARLLAVFPLIIGHPGDTASSDQPTYPIEKHFPDPALWRTDPSEIVALWIGAVFDRGSAALALFAGIEAVALPPIGCGQDRIQSVRGIGRIFIGTRLQCEKIVADWLSSARVAIAGGHVHPEDLIQTERLIGFIIRSSETNQVG